jgi:acyl carrier protein
MDLFPKIQSIVATTLKVPPDKITRETSDNDLAAWDSLAHVNLMMTLEQTFNLSLEVEDFGRLTSVAAMLKYLKEKGET